MVKRVWNQPDQKKFFFPVVKTPLYFSHNGNEVFRAKRFYGILDVERNTILSTVSENYSLVTNRRAYEEAEDIVKIVFRNTSLSDMKFYNLIQFAGNLPFAHAHNGAVHIDVFAARHLGVKSCAYF